MYPGDATFHESKGGGNGKNTSDYWNVDGARPSCSGIYQQQPTNPGPSRSQTTSIYGSYESCEPFYGSSSYASAPNQSRQQAYPPSCQYQNNPFSLNLSSCRYANFLISPPELSNTTNNVVRNSSIRNTCNYTKSVPRTNLSAAQTHILTTHNNTQPSYNAQPLSHVQCSASNIFNPILSNEKSSVKSRKPTDNLPTLNSEQSLLTVSRNISGSNVCNNVESNIPTRYKIPKINSRTVEQNSSSDSSSKEVQNRLYKLQKHNTYLQRQRQKQQQQELQRQQQLFNQEQQKKQQQQQKYNLQQLYQQQHYQQQNLQQYQQQYYQQYPQLQQQQQFSTQEQLQQQQLFSRQQQHQQQQQQLFNQQQQQQQSFNQQQQQPFSQQQQQSFNQQQQQSFNQQQQQSFNQQQQQLFNQQQQQQLQQLQRFLVTQGIKVEYGFSQNVLDREKDKKLSTTSPYNIISDNPSQEKFVYARSSPSGSLTNNVSHSSTTISPTSDIAIEMKYETQSGPPTAQPHMTSSGVEPPHSSQGTGIVVGGSPVDAEDVGSLLLPPWGAAGPDFLEPPDVKQTAGGLQDAWDSILGSPITQSMAELKPLPLPPFTGYTGHLSINGIPGHHFHAIAAQRSSIPSASPTPSSNQQEYYESPVVSSSTPCPQGSPQKQQQQHNNQQQSQHHHHHHHHHQQQQPPQQQQQQPQQSTQQVDYDIEDIAEIIGSAIADTTVPGGGNGPNSEQDQETSRSEWMDIEDWIEDACSPKTQDTTSPNPYPSIYVTTPSTQAQQHGSTLQSLLTQAYSPLLQARLQAGNTGLQNASCGETPSSTSPYPPVSPPGRVSTSCSPDNHLHSSFATPSHPRKRSRSTPGAQNPAKKAPGTGATAIPYGTENNSGKEKPVHRCHVCNRGFLNKSNIKVHLRTHTGEKPFRCDVCGKAFRQKAHLIKHQQIHKRVRD